MKKKRNLFFSLTFLLLRSFSLKTLVIGHNLYIQKILPNQICENKSFAKAGNLTPNLDQKNTWFVSS